MPSQVAYEATPRPVTPDEGKGALGAWWTSYTAPERDTEPTNLGARSDVEPWSKPVVQGVYVGQHLSFGNTGKAPWQTVAKVANRTREIRLSGMRRGACGTVCQGSRTEAHGETRGGATEP